MRLKHRSNVFPHVIGVGVPDALEIAADQIEDVSLEIRDLDDDA